MLKTLEEPTSRTILLVTASRPEDLLPTIASRCEVILLRSAGLEEVADSLEKEDRRNQGGSRKDRPTFRGSLRSGIGHAEGPGDCREE